MGEIISDVRLVAYCGLYCGACGSYLKGKCPGCHDNHKASWCKVRSCCMEMRTSSCAECKDFPDPTACRKYNNFISRLFGLVFRSDRAACIRQIKEIGMDGHAAKMAELKIQTIRRR